MSSRTRARPQTQTQTQRGRSGKKWVGLNYKEKERAKEANGGVMPYTLSLVTSDFVHKAAWSEVNLPDILFYVQPPVSKYEGVKVEDLLENGAPVVSDASDRHNIRQFEILPRNISLDVPGWLVEAWRRLDTRIGYQDILDRQYADPNLGLKKHTKNALQNHCRRECRKVLNAWVEYGRRDEPHRTEVEAIEGMSYENVQLNTTLRRSEVFTNRLVKVRLERRVEDGLYYAVPHEVSVENWRETTLPLDHFLPESQPMEMTPSMHAAWEMYLILVERAAVHGYGHWSKLNRSCLPVTWYDRTTLKSVPNDTYDGGCATCTWSMERAIPSNSDVKLEPEDTSSPTKASKRRHSDSRGELWELGDTPMAPKRRKAARLSLKRQRSELGRVDYDSSSAIEDVTFVETYRRDPEDYEYYSISPDGKVREHDEADFYDDWEDDSLSNEDVGDEGLDFEVHKEAQEVDKDKGTPCSYLQPHRHSRDDEEVTGTASNIGADDPFSSPSAKRSHRLSSYRELEHATISFSSPAQPSSRAGPWLRTSAIFGSDSLPEDFGYSRSSSPGKDTLINCDLDEMPGYLPASAFPTDHPLDAVMFTQGAPSENLPRDTSFTSVTTTLPGASFSSNDTSNSTAASSFAEASHIAIHHYHPLPTPTTVSFPTAYFYPLPMTQSQAAYQSLSYPSPPQTATYQHQMSFKSSPPRRPEPEWGWAQNRTRRHSDTDATLGVPGDFAGIGAFEHDLTAISSYLDDPDFDEALDFPQIAHADEYATSYTFEGDVFDNLNTSVQGNGVEDAAIGPMIGTTFDSDFLEEQMNPTTGPLSILQA